jgi:uncharacterized membrane protein (DUF485 family)
VVNLDALRSRVASDPAFQALKQRRDRFNAVLTAIALGMFFAYILTIAFWPGWLAVPLGPDTVITRAIPIGFGVIVLSLALIGFYVVVANRTFDPAQRAIVERAMAAASDAAPDTPPPV